MQKIQLKGSELMIKKIAWNTFKNTGDVNTFLEMKQLQEIQSQMHLGVQNEIMQNMQQQMEAQNGNNQNEWYNNF
jgi:hypothetical protein